jgi:hypothetical protein
MDKKILMIHEFKKEYLKLPLEKYILTFDDGLYSQYYWRKEISKINTEKYLFIITGRCLKKRDTISFDDCFTANDKWLNNKDNSNYMTIDEVKEMEQLGFIIGGHSHYHDKLDKRKNNYKSKLCIDNKFMIRDCRLMINWFKTNFNYIPEYYCFPYNDEKYILREHLKYLGFKYFFGNNRIDILNIL